LIYFSFIFKKAYYLLLRKFIIRGRSGGKLWLECYKDESMKKFKFLIDFDDIEQVTNLVVVVVFVALFFIIFNFVAYKL
jgi:hypothetical protein